MPVSRSLSRRDTIAILKNYFVEYRIRCLLGQSGDGEGSNGDEKEDLTVPAVGLNM